MSSGEGRIPRRRWWVKVVPSGRGGVGETPPRSPRAGPRVWPVRSLGDYVCPLLR